MACNHVSCGDVEKVWLPYTYLGRERGLRPHSYCAVCGLVKSSSSDRPRSIGHYLSAVGAISRELKVTKVQVRLISKELERCGIDDRYGIDRHQQEKLFIDVVQRYLGVQEQIIRKFL